MIKICKKWIAFLSALTLAVQPVSAVSVQGAVEDFSDSSVFSDNQATDDQDNFGDDAAEKENSGRDEEFEDGKLEIIDDQPVLVSDNSDNENEKLIPDPDSVPAAQSGESSGICGDNLTWEIEGNDEEGYTLRIHGTGDMYGMERDGQTWFSYRREIKNIIVDAGVTSIGEEAFLGCERLTSIEIPEGVTSIGAWAFSYCESLTSIELPEGVTSIGEDAFLSCSSLTSIKIPEGVTSIEDDAFSWCESLVSIKLPKGLAIIGNYAFSGCNSLISIEIPEGVTSIGAWAFSYCESLTSIEIPEGVTSIDSYAFQGCSSMINIELPEGLTSIGDHAFENCSSLTGMKLPEGLTSIGVYAFENCSSLTGMKLPEGLTSIGYCAFGDCIGLTSIKLPEGVTCFGGAFIGCSNLTSIELPEGLTSIDNYGFSGCSNLTSMDLPEGLTSIGNHAFENCSSLTGMDLPEGLTSIGDHAFENCSSLTGMKLPEGLTSIGNHAFENCSSLTGMDLPEGLTSIGVYAFSGCSNLTSMDLPEGLMSIDDYAFRGCSNLTSMDLPEGLTSIGVYAFSWCENLQSIKLPEKITNLIRGTFMGCKSLTNMDLPEGLTRIGDHVFESCSSLTGMKLPEGLTSIGDYAFIGCSNLKNIELPKGLMSIGYGAFEDCSSLTDMELPEGVTNIRGGAFENCSKLTKIKISGISTNIGRLAFCGCSSLKSIGILGSVKSIDLDAFYGCSSLTTINLPDGVERIEYRAFGACYSLTSITIPDTVWHIDSIAFEDCDKLTIYGYSGSYAETYANNHNIPFVALDEKVVVPDYDYSGELSTWLQSKGTANSMEYLANDSNFINSLLIAKCDSSFASHVVETMSNMYFRGIDGWKEITFKDTSKDQAIEIITALLGLYEEEINQLSVAETAQKFADIYVSTFERANWAYAVDYGLNSKEIEQLANTCNSDNLSEFFIEGKYNDLITYLKEKGKLSDDSNVIKCIEKFSRSEDIIKSISDNIEIMGYGLSIIKIGSESIKRYCDIISMAKANEIYSEMLQYLSQHCDFSSVRQAADTMYQAIHNESKAQLQYLLDPAVEEIDDFAFDKILEGVMSALPITEIIYKSFKYSTDLSNILFNIDDSQKQKANMRCVAYIGSCLSQWMKQNKELFCQADVLESNKYARKTVFAYYMLLKTRMAGEESTRKYLELIHAPWKKEYTVSLQITSSLNSMEDHLKNQGVLNSCQVMAIACPVNVQVYDQSGNPVLTLLDGTESSGNVGGIYYNVMYHALDQDYVKIVNLPENSGYYLKCVATDMGKVDFCVSSIEGDGSTNRKETLTIPVSTGDEIKIDNISTEQPVCQLTDKKGMNKEYAAQPEKTEPIAVTEIRIGSKTMELKQGDKALIQAEIVPNNALNQDIIWSSEDESIAKVNSDGVVEGIGAGKTKIHAFSAENENITTSVEITVKHIETSHIWDSGKIIKNSTCTQAGEKIYTCTDCGKTRTEEIPAKGHSWSAWKTVTKATVFAPAKQTRTCSVCKKQETRTAAKKLTPTIKLNYTGLILQTRQSTSVVRVSGLANGDSVRSWKSSNTKIVKVDKRGKITAQKTTGKAYITVTLASKKTAKIKVIVQKSAVKTKKLTGLQNKMVLKKGKSITLKPVRYPITSTEKITYATSNKKVVIVNSKGKIKAIAPGKANITVKCGKAKFVIKVSVPKTKTTAISVAKSIKVKKGKSVVLKTKVTPANTDDKTVYKSSNKKVATVTSKGVIKGVKKGKAVITVKSGSKSVKCTVTVK